MATSTRCPKPGALTASRRADAWRRSGRRRASMALGVSPAGRHRTKGYAVLAAVAGVGVALTVVLFWYLAALIFHSVPVQHPVALGFDPCRRRAVRVGWRPKGSKTAGRGPCEQSRRWAEHRLRPRLPLSGSNEYREPPMSAKLARTDFFADVLAVQSKTESHRLLVVVAHGHGPWHVSSRPLGSRCRFNGEHIWRMPAWNISAS